MNPTRYSLKLPNQSQNSAKHLQPIDLRLIRIVKQLGAAPLHAIHYDELERRLQSYSADIKVEVAYHLILGRPPDPGGKQAMLELCRQGSVLDLVSTLYYSAEGFKSPVKINGLRWRYIKHHRRLPYLQQGKIILQKAQRKLLFLFGLHAR